MNEICGYIGHIFAAHPEILYGYADISYSPFAARFPVALVFAVPYTKQLTRGSYSEAAFEEGIRGARRKLEAVVTELEAALRQADVPYYVPPAAQKNETDLEAEFSFKFAAVHAALGWIGKNGVLITESYGPRVRLSAVLLSVSAVKMPCAKPVTQSRCPETCTACISACPCKALTGALWNIGTKRGELIDFRRCNAMRSATIPKLGRKNACGLCMVSCPVGSKTEELT